MGAVIKASYASGGRGSGKAAGDSLKYFSQRPDYQGREADREIVTRDGVYQFSRDREMLEERVEQEEPRYLYRMVMSSGDETMNQRQTEQWAQRTLESQGIYNYMIVAHAGEQGHTTHPHCHVLIPTDRVMTKVELNQLRDEANQQYKLHQSVEAERVKYIAVHDDNSQGLKRSSGGKENEMESEKPNRRHNQDYQLGR